MIQKAFRMVGVLAFALTCTLLPAHASLIGSSVSAKLYYPNLSTVYRSSGPVTVSNGVEFPNNSLTASGSLDVTANQVIWTAAFPAAYGPALFNGIVLTFTGAPVIAGVSVNSGTTITPVSSSFTKDSITFNLAGVVAHHTGDQTILDVQFQPVPEPATLGCLGIAFAGVLIGAARRRRAARPVV